VDHPMRSGACATVTYLYNLCGLAAPKRRQLGAACSSPVISSCTCTLGDWQPSRRRGWWATASSPPSSCSTCFSGGFTSMAIMHPRQRRHLEHSGGGRRTLAHKPRLGFNVFNAQEHGGKLSHGPWACHSSNPHALTAAVPSAQVPPELGDS
jgi:hypothetical protein